MLQRRGQNMLKCSPTDNCHVSLLRSSFAALVGSVGYVKYGNRADRKRQATVVRYLITICSIKIRSWG
jgi:hypothetical protein